MEAHSSGLMNSFWRFTDERGRRVIDFFKYAKDIFMMCYLSARASFFDQAQGLRTIFSVVSAQIYFTGWQALPIISVLALASGALVILQSTSQLSLVGGSSMFGTLLIAIVVRELSPLLTALIVIARSGTAVATEVGNMRVNKEIEALEVMGINPLSFIVFPRVLGGVISVICLAFYFNVVALMGGYLVTRVIQNMPFHYYLDVLSQSISFEDFGTFLLKNTFSGAIIFVTASYQGLQVKNSPSEVPQVTTKAVVNSIISVISFNITVTILSYLALLARLGVI